MKQPSAAPGPRISRILVVLPIDPFLTQHLLEALLWPEIGKEEAVHLREGNAKDPLRGVATAEGIAVYDLKQQALQSLLLVFSGTYGRPNDEAVCACGAVVEWDHKRSNR